MSEALAARPHARTPAHNINFHKVQATLPTERAPRGGGVGFPGGALGLLVAVVLLLLAVFIALTNGLV